MNSKSKLTPLTSTEFAELEDTSLRMWELLIRLRDNFPEGLSRRKRTAIHEAAHAVVGHHLGYRVKAMRIVAGSKGETEMSPPSSSEKSESEQIRDKIAAKLAGYAVEKNVTGTADPQHEHPEAFMCALSIPGIGIDDVSSVLREEEARALRIAEDYRPVVQDIAREVANRNSLSEADLSSLLASVPNGAP